MKSLSTKAMIDVRYNRYQICLVEADKWMQYNALNIFVIICLRV